MKRVVLLVLLASCSKAPEPFDGGFVEEQDSGVAEPDAGFDAGQPYMLTIFDRVRIDTPNGHNDGGVKNLQRARASFTATGASFARATLKTELHTTCFPFSTAAAPPPGQRWPAECDAFDRNYEFTVDATTDGGRPGFEVIRAITPFGGPLTIEQDVTDLLNAQPGSHTLDVVIPAWSDSAGQVSGSNGGWNVTAKLDVVPGAPPRKVLAVIPLMDHSASGPDAGSTVTFTTPAGATRATVEYRVTGHGGGQPTAGCIGPSDEFCERTHKVFADGTQLSSFTPWRDNCDKLCTLVQNPSPSFQYCKENPCGSIQSVRAPRANWCPGSLTPPFAFQVPAFTAPGAHQFRYRIENVGAGGVWRVSATLYLYGS